MVFLGDIHGNFNVLLYYALENKNKDLLNIIQVGDFGAGFNNYFESNMNYLNQTFKESNVNLYVIRGNHDNPKYFNGKYNWSNIRLLKDYTILNIENKRILLVGGAISIDRKQRTNGLDWWEEEIFNLNKDKLTNMVDIDIVVTHSSPDFTYPKGINDLVKYYIKFDHLLAQELPNERSKITEMYNILKEKNNITDWLYGHFHSENEEIIDNTKFTLLGINQFKTI